MDWSEAFTIVGVVWAIAWLLITVSELIAAYAEGDDHAEG